jgi:hypothetical protein
VEIARVVELKRLVDKPGIQVNIAVQDLGGSTDVSPTQSVYFTLYSKGEMFSTDAAFKIADVLSLKSARRISGGVYEVVAFTYDSDAHGDYAMRDRVFTIDARKAITEIKAVNCGGDFDCAASTNFKSTIEVVKNNPYARGR